MNSELQLWYIDAEGVLDVRVGMSLGAKAVPQPSETPDRTRGGGGAVVQPVLNNLFRTRAV